MPTTIVNHKDSAFFYLNLTKEGAQMVDFTDNNPNTVSVQSQNDTQDIF